MAIEIDKKIVGSIGHGETVDLSVEPGHHTLRLGPKRHLSPERSFEIVDGEVVNFRCRGKFGLGAYIIAHTKQDFWIWLRQESTDSPRSPHAGTWRAEPGATCARRK